MTPAARAGAAVALLDRVLEGEAAEAVLTKWARASRYAGSGDRAAVRDLVFDALRRRRSRAALGGGDTGRGLILGGLRETGQDPDTIFGAGPHAPGPLTEAERQAGRAPTEAESLNLPEWLLPAFADALGPDLPAVAERLGRRAPVWLRVNLLKGSPDEAAAVLAGEGILVAPAPDLPQALRVTDGARKLRTSAAYREGLVELQDIAPQRAVALLGQLAGADVLDFCAGGGGKALALAAAGAGRVVAHDRDARRMADLPARAARAGADIAIVAPAGIDGQFDLVVADVPCSGTGAWARSPEARWRLTPAVLDRLLQTQAEILDNAAPHVRPGGRLALMTCSLLTAENQAQATAFLGRHPDFTAGPARLMSPLEGGDGFFVACFQRDED